MFGKRTIATLRARNERLAEQRDYHHSRADRAQRVSSRIASKFTTAYDLCWGENARLHDMVADQQNLITRHARLVRACVRYRAENARLQAKVAFWSGEGTDRALVPADPIDVSQLHTRRERELLDQLAAMQAVLDRVQADELAAARKALDGLTDHSPAEAA